MAANNILTDYPEPNIDCYSDIGAVGTKTSNLEIGTQWQMYDYSPAKSIINWTHDKSNVVEYSVGHRRWVLNPFMQKSAYGSVSASSIKDKQFPYVVGTAHKTIYSKYKPITAALGVIAYPYQNYPAKYFMGGALLSISILIDQNDYWANQYVDYSKATLVVTE